MFLKDKILQFIIDNSHFFFYTYIIGSLCINLIDFFAKIIYNKNLFIVYLFALFILYCNLMMIYCQNHSLHLMKHI